MEFGMNSEGFLFLTVIGLSLLIGLIVGSIFTLYINMKENKGLQKEADKFRDLYFEELDKWKDKYNDNDYEAY